MLDHIDDIDWPRLGHAYGSAADVPDQLRDLRSPDRQVRETALDQLYGNIFHQGSRYQASAYAVPFLLELLADPATPDRDALLSLLTSLAIGYDETWLPGGFPVAEYRAAAEGSREVLAGQPPPWTGDDESQLEYAEYEYQQSLSEADRRRMAAYVELAAYDAVRAGVPLFRTLLTDPDPGVRICAAYALAWFPEDAPGSAPALVAAADSALAAAAVPTGAVPAAGAVPADGDGDGSVDGASAGGGVTVAEAATALVAAGLLGVAADAALLADPRPTVRWAAAVARSRVHGEETDEATVAELRRWASATTGQGENGPYVPFSEGDLSGYAGASLRQVGPRHVDSTLDALLDRLPTVDGEEALRVITVALQLAFPAGPLPTGAPPEALDQRQRRLAEALVASPRSWLLRGYTFGNITLLLRGYGLPSGRDELAAYLG